MLANSQTHSEALAALVRNVGDPSTVSRIPLLDASHRCIISGEPHARLAPVLPTYLEPSVVS